MRSDFMLTGAGVLAALVVLTVVAVPAAAQFEPPDDRPYVDAASVRSGFQYYREGRWGQVRSAIRNPTAEVQTPLVSKRLSPMDGVEFARRLWLPPHSRHDAYVPVVPLAVPEDANSVAAPARIIDDSRRQERGSRWAESLLPVRSERVASLHMGDLEDAPARDLVRALRGAGALNDVVLSILDRRVPTQPMAWQGVDTLSVSTWSPELTGLHRDSLRRWLVGGGRLWIMLEQVDTNWASQVLGESWDIAVVDRVGLHELVMEGPGGPHEIRSRAGIEMVRVFPPADMEVVHTVDGYPASLRQQVGLGEVLVTTLGPEAWMDDEGEARPPLATLDDFIRPPEFSEAQRQQIAARAFEPFVREQIGYEILGRGWVATVLGLFVVALVAAGGVLAWRGRLEMIGIAGTVVALAAAASLYGLGMRHQGAHPTSVVTGQLVHTVPDQPYVKTFGVTGIYLSPAAGERERTIEGTHGVQWPAMLGAYATVTRLEWTDHDRWLYRRDLPQGTIHRYAGPSAQPVDEPLRATLRFTSAGLEGEVTGGGFGQWEDALVATRWGHLPVRFDGGGEHFTVGSPLGRQQFIAGVEITHQQQRRQRVYRALAGRADNFDTNLMPEAASLMGWAAGGPANVNLGGDDGDVQRQVHSLVMAPLTIEPPAPGVPVTLPPALLAKRPAGAEVDLSYRPGAVYDDRYQRWHDMIRSPATAMMRYELPEAVRAIDLERVTVHLNLRAPGWRYEVLVWRDGEIVSVAEGTNPLGQVPDIRLTGADLPEMRDDGALLVGLRVTRPDDTTTSHWSPRQLELSVEGVGAER